MPYQVRDLPALITLTTASTSAGPIGHLDDASNITLFFASSATALTSAIAVMVSQFDPADPFPQSGVTQSSQFYSATSSTFATNFSSSGIALVISNVSFRGLKLNILASANVAGEIIAFATKQISV
jgi:hypothetical protein